MNYKNIIDDMVWSYSRIKTFDDCKYKFLLKYIFGFEPKELFFASYGKLMHKIIELYSKGELKKEELTSFYFDHFFKDIVVKAPNPKIWLNYANSGYEYLRHIDDKENIKINDIIGVEEKMYFNINDYMFVGIIDSVLNNEDYLIICDNKSKTLNERSKKGKATKSDKELDSYLRQLFIYSIPVNKIFGKQVDKLMFNCFRSQKVITEPFDINSYSEAKQWVLDKISSIKSEEEWEPTVNYFYCKNLCDMQEHCEYYEINFSQKG